MRAAIGALLVIVGLGWAGLGAWSCTRAVGPDVGVEGREVAVGGGIIGAAVLFVLPGLVVAGIGALAAGKG